MMKNIYLTIIFGIAVVGCASNNPNANMVRVTDNTEVVRSCKFVGNVRAASMFGGAIGDERATTELQSKVADLGGNVLYLLTSKSGKSVADGASATGEAYRCD